MHNFLFTVKKRIFLHIKVEILIYFHFMMTHLPLVKYESENSAALGDCYSIIYKGKISHNSDKSSTFCYLIASKHLRLTNYVNYYECDSIPESVTILPPIMTNFPLINNALQTYTQIKVKN